MSAYTVAINSPSFRSNAEDDWLKKFFGLFAVTALVLGLGRHAAAESAADHLRLVALTGPQAIGLPAGNDLTRLGHVLINSEGQVAFVADNLIVPQDPYRQSLWAERPGGELRLVAQKGDMIAGAIGAGIEWFPYQPLAITSSGQVAFAADLPATSMYGTPSNNHTFVIGEPDGELRLVAQGDPLRSLPTGPRNFGSLHELHVNDAGVAAFLGGKFGDGANFDPYGVWVSRPQGEPELIARVGDEAPGAAGGKFWNMRMPELNDLGQVAFRAHVTRLSGGTSSAIFAQGADGLTLVAAVGGQVPGAAPGVTFTDLDAYARIGFNDRGEVSFGGRVSSWGNKSAYQPGIWVRNHHGGTEAVVRPFDPAPGVNGANFREIHYHLFDNAGRVTFQAKIEGPEVAEGNYQGIWQTGADGSGLTLIVREGDAAPGGGYFSLGLLGANNAGQVVFSGHITESSVDDVSHYGIWATSRDGAIHEILRTGDIVSAGGQMREVAEVSSWGGRPGDITGSSFNDRGELALWATFTDGTVGVFVSSVAAIPEPAAAVLLAAGAVASAGLRRLR